MSQEWVNNIIMGGLGSGIIILLALTRDIATIKQTLKDLPCKDCPAPARIPKKWRFAKS